MGTVLTGAVAHAKARRRILVILLQDKSSLKKVPRWLRGYLRTNIYIEKDDSLFFRKLVIGMPQEYVTPRHG